MELLQVLVGKTVKDVQVEQIDRCLFKMTVGRASLDEDCNGDAVWYVRGKSQVIPAADMYDACYKAHHLAKVIG